MGGISGGGIKMSKASEKKEIKLLMRLCLFLWKAVVKAKAGGVCEYSGKTKRLQIHHIESYSTNKGLRYDPRNGICLTMTFHKWGGFSAHKSFIFMFDLMTLKRKDDIDYLRVIRQEKVELTKEYLQQTAIYLYDVLTIKYPKIAKKYQSKMKSMLESV
jgi:hypothetical protein